MCGGSSRREVYLCRCEDGSREFASLVGIVEDKGAVYENNILQDEWLSVVVNFDAPDKDVPNFQSADFSGTAFYYQIRGRERSSDVPIHSDFVELRGLLLGHCKGVRECDLEVGFPRDAIQ